MDPGCNLLAAVVNFLYSYKTNFYEVCSTKFQRTGLENKLASSIEKLDLGKFDTKKQKRKVNNSCTIAIEVLPCCLMPMHFDKVKVVRPEEDDDLIVCDVCSLKYHPACVKSNGDTYVCCS